MKSDSTVPTNDDPPAHLSASSRALYGAIVPRRARSPERKALVVVALEARDRAEQARELLAAEGMVRTTKKTGMAHMHPAVKLERESRQLFVKCWTALNLGWSQEIDGRA